MLIKSAEFAKSCHNLASCPDSRMPEYAFIGRSNVGKSSLINMLSLRKSLAMTSAKPGKTLLINYFLINGNWFLVDLPGYGFASVSKTEREKLKKMIEEYILGRSQLTNLFLLLDSRLEPQKNDLNFITFLGENGIPFSIVFTKVDKLSKSKLAENISAYKSILSESWENLPPIFATSATTKEGRDELLAYIDSINTSITDSANNP